MIGLWLRDLYGIIKNEPLLNLETTSQETMTNDRFMLGNKIFKYLYDNEINYGVITFVISGLRFRYKNREDAPMPSFLLADGGYVLDGAIIPQDIVYISVPEFIDSINNNKPIIIGDILLDYKDYDFWDADQKKIIKYY